MAKRSLCWNGLYIVGQTEPLASYGVEIDSIEVDDAEEFAAHLEEEEISPCDPAQWTPDMLWKEFHHYGLLESLSKYGKVIGG